jgi:hypothetical protein
VTWRARNDGAPALPSPSGNYPDARHLEPEHRVCGAESDRREVALSFCRECLGWTDASFHGRYVFENKRRPELPHAHSKLYGFQLDPGDCGHVINALKEWCDLNGVGFGLRYSSDPKSKASWSVGIAAQADAADEYICGALMRACLAGRRTDGRRSAAPAALDSPRRNPALLANPWGDIRENAAIALAFCHEILIWPKAYVVNDCGYVYIKESVPKHLAQTPIPPWERAFHFNGNHVDKVIEAVRAWCSTRALGFVLEYFPSGSAKDCWRARVGPDAESHGDLGSAALMSACLVAHRKLTLPESPPCPMLP